jgi:hypothetical protein
MTVIKPDDLKLTWVCLGSCGVVHRPGTDPRFADEDGCCRTCGHDCIGIDGDGWAGLLAERISGLEAQAERLTAERDIAIAERDEARANPMNQRHPWLTLKREADLFCAIMKMEVIVAQREAARRRAPGTDPGLVRAPRRALRTLYDALEMLRGAVKRDAIAEREG